MDQIGYRLGGYTKETEIMEEILKAMKATNAIFSEQVIAKGNLGALERIYTVDAWVLPPGAGMISGRAAIQQFWAEAIKALGVKQALLKTIEAMPAGDGVVEIGQADLETTGGDARVKYVVFWKQEGGHWKWHVDIWNMSS